MEKPITMGVLLLLAGCDGPTAGGSNPDLACGSGACNHLQPDDLRAPILDGGTRTDLASPPDLQPPPDLSQPQKPDLSCAPLGNAKRVFVTSLATSGDLKTNGNAASGLAGGDKLCQNAADAASLGGTFKAWLSSSTTNAIDRIANVGPWYLPDRCTLVFANKAAITSTGPQADIAVTADGAAAPPLDLWTGTLPSGVKDSFTCNDWTNGTFQHEGTAGVGSNDLFAGSWTEVSTPTCDSGFVLICFEE
jgi:hypothetical protein